MKISTAIANAQAQIVLDAADAGHVRIYSGTQPAGPDIAITDQVLLADLALPTPAGTLSGNVITFGAISDDSSANASGTATWGRIVSSTDTALLDFAVGTELTGITTLAATQRVAIDSLTYVVPL